MAVGGAVTQSEEPTSSRLAPIRLVVLDFE